MIEQLVVHSAGPLGGSVPVPDSERILLPRLALGVISRGVSRFVVKEESRSVKVLLDALQLFGVETSRSDDVRTIHGTRLGGLHAASAPVDLRGEAHVAALVTGLVAGRPFASELWVDALVAELLGPVLSGAGLVTVEPLDEGARFTLLARADRPNGLEVTTTGVFPWVKQALLLLALRAGEPSLVDEEWASPDHLERAFERSRVPLRVSGSQIVVHPPRDDDALGPQTWESPGSGELAAYLGVLGLSVPGSEVCVRNASTNPTASAFLGVARLLGARVGHSPRTDRSGEPVADLVFSSSTLRASELAGESMLRLGDAALPLAVALTRTRSVSVLSDLALDGRGADGRILARLVAYLRAAGVAADLGASGLVIPGRGDEPLLPITVTTGGDARLALVGTLLGLLAEGTSTIDDVSCLRDLFPRWVGTLRALGARVEVRTVEG